MPFERLSDVISSEELAVLAVPNYQDADVERLPYV
jgi:hypothetical protein